RVGDAASRRLTGALALPYGDMATGADLLLHGDRLLVLLRNPVVMADGPVEPAAPAFRVLLVDLPGPPRLLTALTVDGTYVDGRQVGGTVRLVVESGPRLRFVYPAGVHTVAAAAAANRRVVQRPTPAAWLPRSPAASAGR